MQQTPWAILMIRPANFGCNPETLASNSFQDAADLTAEEAQSRAVAEFDRMVEALRAEEVEVIVVEDTQEPITPDAIFPNNWISFHEDRRIVTYPMQALNRRLERRISIPELLVTEHEFRISDHLDLSHLESRGIALEGTGSIIFDHPHQVAYANISPRTDIATFEQLCNDLGYRPVSFKAVDLQGQDIYHTNVLLSICDGYAIICSDSIEDQLEKAMVLSQLRACDLEIIEISYQQLNNFCGNVLQVSNRRGEKVTVMSSRAHAHFTPKQLDLLQQYGKVLHTDLTTIETLGGGSARCMMAGIHLPKDR